jgi:hypothetical protein
VKQAYTRPTLASKSVRQAYATANRIPARGYENEEAEARRLAAAYGVSW